MSNPEHARKAWVILRRFLGKGSRILPYWYTPVDAWNHLLPQINAICDAHNLARFAPMAAKGYKPHFRIKLNGPGVWSGHRGIEEFTPVSAQAKAFWKVVEQLEIEYQLTAG